MPIYAYRCDACGFRKDALQKMSDPALTTCPSCGEERFAKQLSAPAFQLKGTGWYATDFRDNGKKADKAAEADTNDAAAGGSGEATGSKTEGGDGKRADGKTDGKTDGKADAGKVGDAGTNGQGGNGAGGAKATQASRTSDGAATPSAAPAPPAKPSPSSTGTSGSGSSAS